MNSAKSSRRVLLLFRDRVTDASAPRRQALALTLLEVAGAHDGPASAAGEDPSTRLDLVVEVDAASELGQPGGEDRCLDPSDPEYDRHPGLPQGLMDVRMPRSDGIEATRLITADPELTGIRVLMLATFDLDQYVFAALRRPFRTSGRLFASPSGVVVEDA